MLVKVLRRVSLWISLAGILLAGSHFTMSSADAAGSTTVYYCVVGTPSSGGIQQFSSPQPGLQCFTRYADAAHALDPYYFCVTGGPSNWKITAYMRLQPGQQCYETVEEAIQSLPPSVASIGNASPQSCSASLPPNAPPGTVAFARCGSGWYVIAFVRPDAQSTQTASSSFLLAHSLTHAWATRVSKLLQLSCLVKGKRSGTHRQARMLC